MIRLDVRMDGEINIDKFEVEVDCPRCGFANPIWLRQARLRDVVICRGCKANIQLDDSMNTVPHLSAVMPGDWSFWKDFLRSNPTIRHVAVEFQTGNKRGVEGTKAVQRLSRLQIELGRGLHPVLIGASQFLTRAASEFDEFTPIDSAPFMKGVKRRSFDDTKAGRAWVEKRTSPGESIDDLIEQNIAGYSAWVDRRCESVPRRREEMPIG